MKNEKIKLRKNFLDKRNSLSQDEIFFKSQRIITNLLNSSHYKNCEYVFSYIEMGSEVITTPFIKQALLDKKIVAVPVSLPKRKMFFVKIQNLDNLQSGIYNTKIPYYSDDDILDSTKETLIIVPGLAYDKNNFRLGYGGGYYDTYLSKYAYKNKIGVFFNIQETDMLPTEYFDIPLDDIIID